MAARSPECEWPLRLGPPDAETPLVIAVPHAGRRYDPELLAASRLPRSALETIEDRRADLLIGDAVALGAVALVAQVARAAVDLNRDPAEIDPAIMRDRSVAEGAGWIASDKVAGGLGVVPSRIAAGGAVWKRPFEAAELTRRVALLHHPYHEAIAAALDAAHARHGVAVLLDCHSMPPLGGPDGPRIVLGDRHGASAGSSFVAAASRAVSARGLRLARNRPYAGGFTLDRHGAPARGRHAIQVEVDRALYLDATLLEPGPGLRSAQTLIGEIAAALIAEASRSGTALAAE